MWRKFIFLSLVIIGYPNYLFANTDDTINEVAVLLDCFSKTDVNIFTSRNDIFYIDCNRWEDKVMEMNDKNRDMNCGQSLLAEWFGSWTTIKKTMEKINNPIPVCFKKITYLIPNVSITRKIIDINNNTLNILRKEVPNINFSLEASIYNYNKSDLENKFCIYDRDKGCIYEKNTDCEDTNCIYKARIDSVFRQIEIKDKDQTIKIKSVSQNSSERESGKVLFKKEER